ncbi:MAG: hypothetical protein J5803_02700 [Desulfovibrio sp.]|nr:hypothetical protein [Desulfovibrio sp.]
MSDATTRVRVMLMRYEQQLLAARRLARFRERMRRATGETPEDPDPAIKRRMYVEKVTKEIYECLLYTGGENPIIEEIRQELSKVVGIPLQFTYPPGKRLRIVKIGPKGTVALTAEEQRKVRSSLLRVTREKIDASMLENHTAMTESWEREYGA